MLVRYSTSRLADRSFYRSFFSPLGHFLVSPLMTCRRASSKRGQSTYRMTLISSVGPLEREKRDWSHFLIGPPPRHSIRNLFLTRHLHSSGSHTFHCQAPTIPEIVHGTDHHRNTEPLHVPSGIARLGLSSAEDPNEDYAIACNPLLEMPGRSGTAI
jgi:hypothetical protein